MAVNTTLCYIERDQHVLMLHRIKKEKDINRGKWIGVGGHFEAGESPDDCLMREVYEETGLTLTSYRFRGIVTFAYEGNETEYMFLYTADGFTGALNEVCSEGELSWVEKKDILTLNLWEGDRIFLKLLAEDAPVFSLKLNYDRQDRLTGAVLNGKIQEET